MSYQTYTGSQYHHRQSSEYGAARRDRGQSSRHHQHAAWSSDYISEPVYSSSDDYISSQNQHPTSAQYESPSMSSHRLRQRGPTLDQTSSQYQPRYEPHRTARQHYRIPSPGPDYIPQSVRTEDEYIATPARTIPGAFVDETVEYTPEYSGYRFEGSSPLQRAAPRDYDGRREVYDSPPYLAGGHRQYPKNGGRSHQPDFKQSHGRKSQKYEDYQEAKQFLDRFHAFDAQRDGRVDDPSDEESERSGYDSDWNDQHAYNARSNMPDDFQAVKEALERIRAIGAPKPPPTKAEYAPRDESKKKKKKKKIQTAPRHHRKEPKVPKEQRRWDVPNTSRRRVPQPRLDDYKEAKQFLARFQALEAKSRREEDEEEEVERSDEEEYISESASDHDYTCNETRKQITYTRAIEPRQEEEEEEEEQRWDAPHPATRKSCRDRVETYPGTITTVAHHEDYNERRSPSPPASDIASYRSTALSGPPSRVPSTARSYRARSVSVSRSPSVHSQASDYCSMPPSASTSASTPQSPRIQPQLHTLPPSLPSYSSFSRPPQDEPRARGRRHSQASDVCSISGSRSRSRSASPSPAPDQRPRPQKPASASAQPSYSYSYSSFSRPPQDAPRRHSPTPSRRNGRGSGAGSASHTDSDDNGIAEGSDYLPSDTDPSDNENEHSNKGINNTNNSELGLTSHRRAADSDDNGIGEGSDYLSTDDEDELARRSDVCSVHSRGGAGKGKDGWRGAQSESGDDDDEGDYMSAEDEGLIGERYYGR